MMETILEYLLGWAVEYTAADPRAAVYGVVAYAAVAFGLTLFDNLLAGQVRKGRWQKVRRFLVLLIRALNRYATPQGGARTVAGKLNRKSATAARADNSPDRINLRGVI
jgi:hypothetical protein